jgi:NADPH-dependent 2,4-dienoyl-CoA reductase/sulfur reductase-like enzyme
MIDSAASVEAPQRGGAGESKSEQVLRRLSEKHKPRVVSVGGGFAGIAAAKSLRGCYADVTLIDRRNHDIFQPLLYQVATALPAPSEVATPIADCAPETFGYQLPHAPRDLYRNVIREVNAGSSKTSETCQSLGLSRI